MLSIVSLGIHVLVTPQESWHNYLGWVTKLQSRWLRLKSEPNHQQTTGRIMLTVHKTLVSVQKCELGWSTLFIIPLIPSDQNLTSPYNTTTRSILLYRLHVQRKWSPKITCFDVWTDSLNKCSKKYIENIQENLHVDIGLGVGHRVLSIIGCTLYSCECFSAINLYTPLHALSVLKNVEGKEICCKIFLTENKISILTKL